MSKDLSAHASFGSDPPASIAESVVTGSALRTACRGSQQPEVIDERHLIGMTLRNARREREVLKMS
jgi:hypothetical protein